MERHINLPRIASNSDARQVKKLKKNETKHRTAKTKTLRENVVFLFFNLN